MNIDYKNSRGILGRVKQLMRKNAILNKKNLPIFVLTFSLVFVLCLYEPILLPIFNNKLVYTFGDFSTFVSYNSGQVRRDFEFYTFTQGTRHIDTNRAFLLQSITLATTYINLSDAQIQGILILVSLLLGCYGIYRVIRFLEKDETYQSLLLLILIPFYFLNLWSVERFIHMWIWMAYAIFPLFLSFGIQYIFKKKTTSLIAYSLLLSFYGVIPHSFIYLLIIHFFIVLLSINYKADVKHWLSLLITPLLIYFLLNLPAFLLLSAFGANYPIQINLDELVLLSRYGELIKILTFSNNWWPHVSPETIFANPLFPLSSLGIFICIVVLSVVHLKNFEKNTKFAILLSSSFILILIFVIQGTNNPFIYEILRIAGENHLLAIAGPFREWSRMSIPIPVFLSLILILCFSKLKKRESHMLSAILVLLVLTNIFTSPALTYLNKIYSPVYIPQGYYELSNDISVMHKTIWISPSQVEDTLGTWRVVWNDEKTPPLIQFSTGSTYPEDFNLIKLIETEESNTSLLGILNIKYIITKTDISRASNFKVNYSWLDCKMVGYLNVCENRDNITPISIHNYGNLLETEDDAQKIYFMSSLSQVPILSSSYEINSTNLILVDTPLSTIMKTLVSNNTYTLVPSSYHHDPYRFWSEASTADPPGADWHPYLEKFDIENWQSDYGRGLVFTVAPSNLSAGQNDLGINFKIKESGNQHLFIRYFENKNGGEIKIILDKQEIPLETKDQLNKFVWRDLGEFYLNEGEHELIIRNVDGLNAVNLFALVPNDDLVGIKREFDISFQNKTVIYAFEGDYDLYHENASLEKGDGPGSRNILAFSPDGKAWQEFEIVKEGYYQIGIRAKGDFNIKIDNSVFPASSNNLSFTYLRPVYLGKGLHKIEFEPALYADKANSSSQGQVYLDAILLYSTDSLQIGQNIEDLLKDDGPTSATSYKMVDPTLWELNVNATKPFMLSFAESYDPLWEARVYKDGRIVDVVKSTQLYEVMNGFSINQTGNLNIVLRYKAQDWFETGLIISGLTLAFCLLYAIYDVIKDRRTNIHNLKKNCKISQKFNEKGNG